MSNTTLDTVRAARASDRRCPSGPPKVRALLLVVAMIAMSLGTSSLNPAQAATGGTPILGNPILTQDQLVNWYLANVPSNRPLRAGSPSVSIRSLVKIYYEEGAREGIAPDLAFLQALHETAWFNFPAGGCVRPTDHNFAGIGAYDCHILNSNGLPANVWRWHSVREGVRGHLQYLRAYADARVSTPADLGAPIPPVRDGRDFTPQWQWMVSTYRVRNGGPWPFYEQYGAGIWAADPLYWPKIRNYIERALTFNGLPADAAQRYAVVYTSSRPPSGAIPLMGDWNGDGVDTPGWFRDGTWALANRDGTIRRLTYGRSGDVPVTGDFNGDGIDTIGVVRTDPDGRLRYILRYQYRSGADIVMHYGRVGDIPVTGDWNGNGIDTIGVVRTDRDGRLRFILRYEYRSGADIVLHYGRQGDVPVVGDFNGDGVDTLGVRRGSRFILRYVYRSGADIVLNYGRPTDAPLIGDFNGNGTDTLGVRRAEEWILRYVYRSGADILYRW